MPVVVSSIKEQLVRVAEEHSEALALYLRPRGIGVSCSCPAGVATPEVAADLRDHGAYLNRLAEPSRAGEPASGAPAGSRTPSAAPGPRRPAYLIAARASGWSCIALRSRPPRGTNADHAGRPTGRPCRGRR